MSKVSSEVSSNDSTQHQPPLLNQPKQPNDPWNNSWNWDFDKQTDNQQQQPPQQEQQQQLRMGICQLIFDVNSLPYAL